MNDIAMLKKYGAHMVYDGIKEIKGKNTGQRCKTFVVNRKLDKPLVTIPKVLEAIPTDVVEMIPAVALQLPTDKWRPAPGGVSIGHYAITAGTLGVVCKDSQGRRVILSNNHVLANCNDSKVGDSIYQPGPYDGGTEADLIAHLLDYVPIAFEGEEPPDPEPDGGCKILNFYLKLSNLAARIVGSRRRVVEYRPRAETPVNLVDAALALPLSDDLVSDEILEVGLPNGTTVEAEVYMNVHKYGRTSMYTPGDVIGVNATVQVGYGEDRVAYFEDQIITSKLADPGDSGSLVLRKEDNAVVGLLFGGSNQATIVNRIANVQDALGVTF